MTLNALVTLGILTASVHWIIARSHIMKWFWNAIWLPEFVSNLLACPACSGFWLGLGAGIVAPSLRPLTTGHWWIDIPGTGLAGLFMTPLVQAVLLWGLRESDPHQNH